MNRHIFNGVGLSLPQENQAEIFVMWGWCLRKRNIEKMVLMRYDRRFPLFTLEYQLFRRWKFVISLYVTKYQLLKRNEKKFFDYISKSIYFNLWCCTKCGKWNRTLSKQLELCLKSRRLIVNLRIYDKVSPRKKNKLRTLQVYLRLKWDPFSVWGMFHFFEWNKKCEELCFGLSNVFASSFYCSSNELTIWKVRHTCPLSLSLSFIFSGFVLFLVLLLVLALVYLSHSFFLSFFTSNSLGVFVRRFHLVFAMYFMAVYIEQWMFVVFVFSCNYICTSKSNIIFDDGCNIIRTIFARKKWTRTFSESCVHVRERKDWERWMVMVMVMEKTTWKAKWVRYWTENALNKFTWFSKYPLDVKHIEASNSDGRTLKIVRYYETTSQHTYDPYR